MGVWCQCTVYKPTEHKYWSVGLLCLLLACCTFLLPCRWNFCIKSEVKSVTSSRCVSFVTCQCCISSQCVIVCACVCVWATDCSFCLSSLSAELNGLCCGSFSESRQPDCVEERSVRSVSLSHSDGGLVCKHWPLCGQSWISSRQRLGGREGLAS